MENAFSSPKTVDKCPGNAYNCIVLKRSAVAFPLSEARLPLRFIGFAPLAKLDIASVYGTEGQEFESLTVHQKHGRTTVLPCFCIIRTVRNPSSRECARGGSWVRSTERAENKQLPKPSMASPADNFLRFILIKFTVAYLISLTNVLVGVIILLSSQMRTYG